MIDLEHIQKWERPESFVAWTNGEPYNGEWYVFLTRHRDSSVLEQSNFQRGLEIIGGESDSVIIVRESHWAVGWVEWIAIHESDHDALEQADEIMGELELYPIIDDMHYSQAEYDAILDYWGEDIRLRAELCRDAEYSVMGARHDFPPTEVFDHIRELGVCA